MSADKSSGSADIDIQVSYSRLQSFGNCPAQYRFRYLDRIPEPGLSIEAFLGRRLHEALEWLYLIPDRNKVSFDLLLARFREIWAGGWDSQIMIARPGMRTDDYYQLGQRALAGYFRQRSPFDEPVIAVEKAVTFSLGGSPAVGIKGIIDRLDRPADGHFVINDYKSGRRMLTARQAATDLQMRVYFLALHHLEQDVQRVDIVWHYLQHGQIRALDNVDWSPDQIESLLRRKIKALLAAHDQPEKLQPRESPLCNWCYYWERCPAKRGQQHPARRAK